MDEGGSIIGGSIIREPRAPLRPKGGPERDRRWSRLRAAGQSLTEYRRLALHGFLLSLAVLAIVTTVAGRAVDITPSYFATSLQARRRSERRVSAAARSAVHGAVSARPPAGAGGGDVASRHGRGRGCARRSRCRRHARANDGAAAGVLHVHDSAGRHRRLHRATRTGSTRTTSSGTTRTSPTTRTCCSSARRSSSRARTVSCTT